MLHACRLAIKLIFNSSSQSCMDAFFIMSLLNLHFSVGLVHNDLIGIVSWWWLDRGEQWLLERCSFRLFKQQPNWMANWCVHLPISRTFILWNHLCTACLNGWFVTMWSHESWHELLCWLGWSDVFSSAECKNFLTELHEWFARWVALSVPPVSMSDWILTKMLQLEVVWQEMWRSTGV